MMYSELWEKIAADYKTAKDCLWCPRHSDGWMRQEDKGRCHLWQAYYAAKTSEEKEDPLLYARILMMMSHENYNYSDYDRFHKFIGPAKEAYEDAMASGQHVSDKELEEVNRLFNNLQYVLKKTENTTEQIMEAYALVKGLDKIPEFGFHDSKPVHFEYQDDRALLKLDHYGVCVTLEFTGLTDVQVDGDPTCNWINDFYCYPLFWNPKYYYFDVGYYRITCEHIRVIEVTRED